MVQAAPTGYSAIIDPPGRVVTGSGLGGAALLERPVELRTGTTLAVKLGTVPLIGAAVVALALARLPGRWRLTPAPASAGP